MITVNNRLIMVIFLIMAHDAWPIIPKVSILRNNRGQLIVCCHEIHIDDPAKPLVPQQQEELLKLHQELNALAVTEDMYARPIFKDAKVAAHVDAWLEQQRSYERFKQGEEKNVIEEKGDQGAEDHDDIFNYGHVGNNYVAASKKLGLAAVSVELRQLYNVSLCSLSSPISAVHCRDFFATCKRRIQRYTETPHEIYQGFYKGVIHSPTSSGHGPLIEDLLHFVGKKSAAHVIELYGQSAGLQEKFKTKEAFDDVVEQYSDRVIDAEIMRLIEKLHDGKRMIVCAGDNHIKACIGVLEKAGYECINVFGHEKDNKESNRAFIQGARPILAEVKTYLSTLPIQALSGLAPASSAGVKRKRLASPPVVHE